MQAYQMLARDIMHVTRLTSADGLPHNQVNSICETSDGQIWIGTWNGLLRCGNGETEGIRTDRNGQRIGRIKYLATTPDGNITYTNEEGIRMQLDVRSNCITPYRGQPMTPVINNETCRYNVDKDGLAIERRGVCYRIPFDKSTNEGNRLRIHYEDSQGGIWLNFNNNVYHLTFTPSPFCYFNSWDGNADKPFRATVRAIFISDNGRLMAGSKDSLIYGLTKDPLPLADDVYAIADDKNGGVWTALRASGLCHISRDGQTSYYTELDNTTFREVYTMLRLNNTLYVGTRKNGLWALDITDKKPQIKAHFADSTLIHSLRLLRNGNIAVCTSQGFRICTQDLTSVYQSAGNSNVRCSAELPDGSILLSTDGHGITRFDYSRNFEPPRTLSNIDDCVLNMMWAPDSTLWLITDNSLLRYNINEDKLDVFDADDFGEDITFSESQCCVYNDSLLYIGATPGMMEVNIKAIDRYLNDRMDNNDGKIAPYIIAAALLTLLIAVFMFRKRRKKTSVTPHPDIAPEIPEVISEKERFIAQLNSVLNSLIPDADADIDLMAAKMNMTRNMLFQRCNEILHYTPAALLQRLRIDRACQLFDAGEKTVKEVASRTGFNDPKYFAKVFKKQKGLKPTQYMENRFKNGGN